MMLDTKSILLIVVGILLIGFICQQMRVTEGFTDGDSNISESTNVNVGDFTGPINSTNGMGDGYSAPTSGMVNEEATNNMNVSNATTSTMIGSEEGTVRAEPPEMSAPMPMGNATTRELLTSVGKNLMFDSRLINDLQRNNNNVELELNGGPVGKMQPLLKVRTYQMSPDGIKGYMNIGQVDQAYRFEASHNMQNGAKVCLHNPHNNGDKTCFMMKGDKVLAKHGNETIGTISYSGNKLCGEDAQGMRGCLEYKSNGPDSKVCASGPFGEIGCAEYKAPNPNGDKSKKEHVPRFCFAPKGQPNRCFSVDEVKQMVDNVDNVEGFNI